MATQRNQSAKQTPSHNQVDALLLDFANTFAEQDEEGNWWGHDTNLGHCKEAFELASKRIKELL